MLDYVKELRVALEAVRRASALTEAVRQERIFGDARGTTMTKDDQSPVTIADYGSQAIICHSILQAFGKDPIVAEEDAEALRKGDSSGTLESLTQYVQRCGSKDKTIATEQVLDWIDYGNAKLDDPNNAPSRFWTLDPIDGTKGFLRGDQYAICLALIVDGVVQVGVLGCPALARDGSEDVVKGQLCFAVRGHGSYRLQQAMDQGIDQSASLEELLASCTRLHVSQESKVMVQSFEASHGNHSAQQAVAESLQYDQVLKMDSQAKYAMVASGRAGLYLRLSNYHENIWDHAAGTILVEEAGGGVTDRRGRPLSWQTAKMTTTSGVVVSSGAGHDQILTVLGNLSPPTQRQK